MMFILFTSALLRGYTPNIEIELSACLFMALRWFAVDYGVRTVLKMFIILFYVPAVQCRTASSFGRYGTMYDESRLIFALNLD